MLAHRYTVQWNLTLTHSDWAFLDLRGFLPPPPPSSMTSTIFKQWQWKLRGYIVCPNIYLLTCVMLDDDLRVQLNVLLLKERYSMVCSSATVIMLCCPHWRHKHYCDFFFFFFFAFAWPCRHIVISLVWIRPSVTTTEETCWSTIKCFVTERKVFHGLFID